MHPRSLALTLIDACVSCAEIPRHLKLIKKIFIFFQLTDSKLYYENMLISFQHLKLYLQNTTVRPFRVLRR